jgi:carbonic anhydrase
LHLSLIAQVVASWILSKHALAQGSFTTPPCTEGVQWLVLANPIYAEAAEIDPIKAKEGNNFRPVQPLYDRKVTLRGCGLQCE